MTGADVGRSVGARLALRRRTLAAKNLRGELERPACDATAAGMLYMALYAVEPSSMAASAALLSSVSPIGPLSVTLNEAL